MSKLAPVAVAAILISVFTVGCNTTSPTAEGTTNQAPTSSSSSTGNGTASNAAISPKTGDSNTVRSKSEGTHVIKAPDARSLSAASMETIAKNLITRYIQTHNDPTMTKFKADAEQIFYPGLANFVIKSARSGTDYNHPVKSHRIAIAAVAAPNAHTFVAQATVELYFQDGTSETLHYQFSFAPNGKGNWTIQSMRGA